MTREEILRMDASELEARAKELAKESESATVERMAEIGKELDAIEERKAALEIQKRAAAAVAGGAGQPIGQPSPKAEKKTLKEVRDSQEYIEAFAKYVRTNNDRECRALLTANVEEIGDNSGPVPVPTFIEERIRNAWERDEIWSRVRKVFVPGNHQVGFEISATDAVWHEEGTDAPTEEQIILGIVTMVPKNIKKWITVSDEVLALGANDLLVYLYDEMTYKIIRFASQQVMARIDAAPAASTSVAVGVPVSTYTGTNPTTADIINAKALLKGDVRDIVVVCSRETEAAVKVAALGAGFAYDPFDGSEVVHFDFPVSTTTKMVIGDLGAVLANLPEGDNITFKYDDLSLAEQDLVKIVGRMMAAIAVTEPGALVKVQPAESDDSGE